MPFKLNPLTGSLDLVSSISGYPKVDTYADLPSVITYASKVYLVLTSTGTWYLFNRKEAGLYYSDGVTWNRLGSYISIIDDTITSTQMVWSSDKTNTNLLGKQIYHGVVNPNAITFNVNNSTRTLTINYNSFNYYVYIGGNKYTVSSNLSIQIGTSLGQHFIWYYVNNGNIVLGTSQTNWDILDTTITPCATIHWDGVTMIPSSELHDYRRNLIEHNRQHTKWGAQYESGFTSIPTFNTNNTFSFIGGVISDEDIVHSLSGTLTTCRIGYRVSGGATMTFDNIGTEFVKLNTGIIQYDNNGTLTSITNNQYGVYWVYATNRKESTALVSILSQSNYNTITSAQSASYPVLAGMQVAEWKLLYKVILRRTNSTFQVIQIDPLYNISTGPPILASSPSTISAGNVTVISIGNITSNNVQSALQELDNRSFDIFSFAVSDESTNLTVGTSKITVHWPFNFTPNSVFIGVNTASTITSIIVDANDKNGNSIFTTRPTILAGEFTSLTNPTQPIIITNTSFLKGDKLTIDIDQVGAVVAGNGLKIYFIGIKS